MNLEGKLKSLLRTFVGSDEASWAGHGLQGFALGYVSVLAGHPWPGMAVNTGIWLHRELSNLLMPWLYGNLTASEAWDRFRNDGIFDLIVPFITYGFGWAAAVGTIALL